MPASLITIDEFRQVLREGMPSAQASPFDVVTLERGLAVLRLTAGDEHLTLLPGFQNEGRRRVRTG